MSDSWTHIAGDCPDHKALRISRHNAACQLSHAAIRRTTKGGGALHSAHGLVLVMSDAGKQPMSTGDSIESLSPTSEDTNLPLTTETRQYDWLAPLSTSEDIRHRRHTDVSQDPRYIHWSLSAAAGDTKCTAAPSRLPDWVLPREETQMLFDAENGTSPDLIYARGVPGPKHSLSRPEFI
jgi:hypothetical protein